MPDAVQSVAETDWVSDTIWASSYRSHRCFSRSPGRQCMAQLSGRPVLLIGDLWAHLSRRFLCGRQGASVHAGLMPHRTREDLWRMSMSSCALGTPTSSRFRSLKRRSRTAGCGRRHRAPCVPGDIPLDRRPLVTAQAPLTPYVSNFRFGASCPPEVGVDGMRASARRVERPVVTTQSLRGDLAGIL